MTTVAFFYSGQNITGFEIHGHSTEHETDAEGKIVCAAVSSAAYMTVNTLTEITGAAADIEIDDAQMYFRVTSRLDAAQQVLEGFWLHISQLAKDYSNRITLLSEV